MLGTYSYNEIFRKTIVSFGTLFNNIEIRRSDEVMKVPLAYGPKQKFLARLDQNPDPTNKRVQITLPRLSFEINDISYDATRKVSPTQKIKFKKDADENRNVYMPVPYNIGFELAIIAKNQDDGLQIIEQILPIFQPHYNLSVKLLTTVGETKDVPIVLNNIDYEDDYEGDFATRRAIIYTLSFTAKTYLYGPVTDAKVVRKTQVDYYANTDTATAPRAKRYTVQPESTIDRDGTVATTLSGTISKTATGFAVANASGINQWDNIYIGAELMRVSNKVGNNLSVIRGYEKSVPTVHSVGSNVFIVNADDNILVESDDDFGFGEIYSEFTDMKKYNPVSGQDENI